MKLIRFYIIRFIWSGFELKLPFFHNFFMTISQVILEFYNYVLDDLDDGKLINFRTLLY